MLECQITLFAKLDGVRMGTTMGHALISKIIWGCSGMDGAYVALYSTPRLRNKNNLKGVSTAH